MATSVGREAREPVAKFSALPGCYIFVVLGCMVLGVVVWGAYTFTHQAREIEQFTATSAVTLPVRKSTDQEITALRDKLTAFQKSAEGGTEASLTLGVDELNTLLAGFESLSEIRPLLVCREIDADGRLVLESSLPINSLSGRRYLNGRLICKLGAHEKAGLFIAVTDIQVPGKSVPAGFIDVYQRGIIPGKTFGFLDDALLRNFRADPAVSPTLARVKSVAASNGSVTLVTRAAPAAPAGAK